MTDTACLDCRHVHLLPTECATLINKQRPLTSQRCPCKVVVSNTETRHPELAAPKYPGNNRRTCGCLYSTFGEKVIACREHPATYDQGKNA